MKLEYRAAEEGDTEQIFQMSRENIDQYEDTNTIDYEKVLAWMRRKIENCIGEYVRVLCNTKTAGYYRTHQGNGKVELDDLYLFPAFQNCGIGTAVITRCLAETERPVFLYVFTRNVRAMALYRRLGFQVTEQVGKTRCIMERCGTK